MKRIHFLIVLSVFAMFLLLSADLPAANRGIRVALKAGDDLFLYKDYQALVVVLITTLNWQGFEVIF
jgi:hypothetical protein